MNFLYYVLLITCLNLYLSSTVLAIDGKKSVTPTTALKGFVKNEGQVHNQDYKANTQVKYLLSTGKGMNVQLLTNSFAYDTYWVEEKCREDSGASLKSKPNSVDLKDESIYHFHRVDVKLIGANPRPEIEEINPSKESFSYYNAVTTDEGAINVKHYKKIIYKRIYPNIDLEFEINPRSSRLPFKYNFVVHTGGDINDIKLLYKGADKTLLKEGSIEVSVSHTSFLESIPLSFEKTSKKEIEVSYKQLDKNLYGFESEQYDVMQGLVIDPEPELTWGTYYGNNNSYSDDEAILGSALDNNGKLYVVGKTRSLSSVSTSGTHQTVMAGEGDGFLSCFDTSNGNLIWGTYYGGETGDAIGSIVLDNVGNIYVQGETFSSTGIATSSTHQPVINSVIKRGFNTDTFLVRFNSQGIREWATYFGKDGYDHRAGIAVDDLGSVYTLMNSRVNHHNYDAIVASFDTSTGLLNWETSYGGDNYEYTLFSSNGITTDNLGKLYITGRTRSTTGIATSGVHQETLSGKEDTFVAKLDASTGTLDWGTYFGGTENDISNAITVDNLGKLYITGRTISNTGIAINGVHQNILEGDSDAFIAKFDTSTGVLDWSTYFGGENNEMGLDIVSRNENIYVCGTTNSSTNIATTDAYQTIYKTYAGNRNDAFIAKLDDSGLLIWATYYGGIEHEGYALSLAVSSINEIYLSGNTQSSTNIATSGAYQATKMGYEDAFIAKFRDTFICKNTALLTFPSYQLNEVINTSAQTLSDNWLLSKYTPFKVYGSQDLPETNRRPYIDGKQGIWRGESSFAYVTDRKQTQPRVNLSKDGTYTLNMFNWKYLGELDCPEWRKVETVSEYHPQSSDVERYNILKLYSSFHIGYSDQLVSAAAANSKQYEFGFEGFEEYTSQIDKANANLLFATQTTVNDLKIPYWFTLETGRNRRIWAPLELQTLQNQYAFAKLHVLGKQIDVNYPGEFRSHTTFEEITLEDDKSLIKFSQNEAAPFEGFWTGKVGVTIDKIATQTFSGTAAQLIDGIAHTGTKSLKISASASFEQPYLLLIPNKKYVVSAWVRVDQENKPLRSASYQDYADLKVKLGNGTDLEFKPQGQIIEGWQRIEGSFTVPNNGMGEWSIELASSQGLTTYFDDIRLFPSLGNMESFVYDTETFRLEAKLDANNYATFYYYDAEGRLYLVKQETSKGVQTLQTVTTHTKRD